MLGPGQWSFSPRRPLLNTLTLPAPPPPETPVSPDSGTVGISLPAIVSREPDSGTQVLKHVAAAETFPGWGRGQGVSEETGNKCSRPGVRFPSGHFKLHPRLLFPQPNNFLSFKIKKREGKLGCNPKSTFLEVNPLSKMGFTFE